MPTESQLILPPKALASCIAGCIVRDTRMTQLSEMDRVNYFPASPLFAVTLVLSGQILVADKIIGLAELRDQPAVPKRLFTPPQEQPHISWSPGPIFAVTIGFFPDAWQRLGGTLDGAPPKAMERVLSQLDAENVAPNWPSFWHNMSEIWQSSDNRDGLADWTGSARIREWTYHLTSQLAQTGAGRSLRSAQRRLQRWTGHTKQTLEFFSKVEDVHRLATKAPLAVPVEIAADAGFADQSHMGRALKRATGFSPLILNQKIATEESFWCYRLLSERF